MLPRGDLLRAGAALSGLAGLIHVLNVEEHLQEWWGYGLFFLLASMAQFYFALVLWLVARAPDADDRAVPQADEGFFLWSLPRRTWFQLGVAGNVAIIALYAITRTVGIPFAGPAAGDVEPVTLLSLLSKVCEAGVVACCALLLRPAGARAAAKG
ncbi:MAG TPA: hypothetical protein VGR28_00110 [Candidatus Thermoplasmatota archaeon]|nr:hypothetical protein [Candidatus Thermoplasmatota archaeon]